MRSGVLVVNKPKSWTSHDVVNKARQILGVKKVGHAGTLDPLASGVLVLLVGATTKYADKLRDTDKEYLITMVFGQSTTTLDAEGKVVERLSTDDERLRFTPAELKKVVEGLQGEFGQRVPVYSAVKVGGQKLYHLARQMERKAGQEGVSLQDLLAKIERPVKKVTLYRLELISLDKTDERYPCAKIRLSCSKGTYARSVVEEIGGRLDLPAYQSELIRTQVGPFNLDEAITMEELEKAAAPSRFVQPLLTASLEPIPEG